MTGRILAGALILALSFGVSAHAQGFPLKFEDMSGCNTDSDASQLCHFVSRPAHFAPWTEDKIQLVRDSLNKANWPKALQFFQVLENLGLHEIHFINADQTAFVGDQAETFTDAHIAYIVLRPAFFKNSALYGAATIQQHALIHELFHVWMHYSTDNDYFADPFWHGLAGALEWTYPNGHTTMVRYSQKFAAMNDYIRALQVGDWPSAIAIDLNFSRSAGFPSFYSMTMISEYLPELGSFLIHDAKMQNDLPRPVVDFLRHSPLAFLLDRDEASPGLVSEVRAPANKPENEFVGMLFLADEFRCTVFLVQDGVAATAKHCIDPGWVQHASPFALRPSSVHYNFLSLKFPRADGSRLRVDGFSITGIYLDRGRNDFAFLTYDASATRGKLHLPSLHFMKDASEFNVAHGERLYSVGFPMPKKAQRLERMQTADCRFDGQVGVLTDPQYQGPVVGTTCRGWEGASGSPLLSERPGEPGHFNLWGVLTDTFNRKAGGQFDDLVEDGWGPHTDTNFSPVYLAQDFMSLEQIPMVSSQSGNENN